jgi:WD40 repeat protein
MARLPGRFVLLVALVLSPSASRAETPKLRLDAAGDPLPDGALARIGTTRLRHAGSAINVAFSPDGKLLASCGNDGLVRLWEPATGKEICRFKGHEGNVNGLAFSPDGKTLLSSGSDKTARLWDVATGKQRLVLTGHTDAVKAVAFAPDGKTIATEDHDAVGHLWDADTGKELQTFSVARNAGTSNLAFTPDGKGLAVALLNYTVLIFDTANGQEVRRFVGHTSQVNSLHFSQDGKMLASASSERRARLWDVATGKELRQLLGHDNIVTSVRFSPDGKTVVTSSVDKTVRLWDVVTGKELRCCVGHLDVVSEVAFSPDGRILASASRDQTVKLWNPATGKELPQSAGPGLVACAALSADGKLVVTGHPGDGLRLWDPVTGRPLGRASLDFQGPVTAVAVSADGKLIAAGNEEGDCSLWDAATGKKCFAVERPRLDSAVTVLTFSPDGRSLAVIHGLVRGRVGTGIDFHDTASGKRLPSSIHEDGQDGTSSTIHFPPHELVIAPNGQTFVTSSRTDGVLVREVATGKVLHHLSPPRSNSIHGLSLSPDGRSLAASTDGGAVRLWEMATGGPRRQFDAGNEGSAAVPIAQDGRLLATAGTEGEVHIRWLLTGRELRSLGGHDGPVTALAFASGGRLLSVSADGTALIWDTSRLKPAAKERPGQIAETAWSELAAVDAAKAFETMTRLSESPTAAVSLLRERLRPVDAVEARHLDQLIVQLDDDDFDKREQASRELEKLGVRVEGALRKAIKTASSAEVVRRAGDLLKKVEEGAVSGERLREMRALEVLEGIGTPEAKKLLDELAKGAAEAALTQEAKASLNRLTTRAVAP